MGTNKRSQKMETGAGWNEEVSSVLIYVHLAQ